MKRLRLLAAIGALIAFGAPLAYAAGLWFGLPIVGQGSYCVSYSGYPTTVTTPGTLPTPNNCNETAPAGPTALTGSELIPADTGLTQGTTSVYIPTPLAASGAYEYLSGQTTPFSSTYNASYTIQNNVNTVLIDPTTTVASLTLVMPASPLNGQIVRVNSSQTLTALAILANTNQTVTGTKPTALTPSATAAGGYGWVWNSTNNTWYRIQ